MPLLLSVFIVLYGIAGLLFAVLRFHVMRERNRIRKETFDAHCDALVYDFIAKLSDARRNGMCPMFKVLDEQSIPSKP